MKAACVVLVLAAYYAHYGISETGPKCQAEFGCNFGCFALPPMPVCGSDREWYDNNCRFYCAQKCNPNLNKMPHYFCPKPSGPPWVPFPKQNTGQLSYTVANQDTY